VEFVPAFYNFNALRFFIDHGFNRKWKMMPDAKKSYRLQTGTNKKILKPHLL
jgi:hypothetical protein